MTALYCFTAYLDEGVRGRMWLNDLPLHKAMTRGPDSLAGGASHLLVTGRNTLSVEVLRLARRGKIAPVSCKIHRVLATGPEPATAPVLSVDLPAAPGRPEGRGAGLPLFHEATFTIDEPLPEPPYAGSPVASFPCDGTPELRRAVEELHEALAARDLGLFLDLLQLKHETWALAYPSEASATMDRQTRAVEAFFARRPAVPPLRLDRLHFAPRAGGRVAHVTGRDDKPALVARTEDDPRIALRTDLLLTQRGGQWRVFA